MRGKLRLHEQLWQQRRHSDTQTYHPVNFFEKGGGGLSCLGGDGPLSFKIISNINSLQPVGTWAGMDRS